MKKLLICILSIILILSMSLILTGCGKKNNASDVVNSNVNNVQYVSTQDYDKVIKAELIQENGEQYNGYEFYTYYYFKDDKLIFLENVYIFEEDGKAQNWYNEHIENLQDKNISRLYGNIVIDRDTNLTHNGSSYENILKMIKEEPRTVGYTEE